MRLAALAVLALGCGTAGADRDAGLGDGAPTPDAFERGDAATDASEGSDAFEPCECAPFEGCVDGECTCGDEPLCGTAGFATFGVADPADRSLTVRGGVVDDAITGLSWERTMEDGSRTHAEARERCAGLSLDGHDDWRLPARVELATILDASRTPTLDGDVFGAAVADYVWTASVAATGADRAFAIYFGQGETILATTDLAGGHVRCVRGDREPASPWVVVGEWLVDADTGLEWSVALEAPASLADAMAACDARGARVPTLYELHALVDEGRVEPATDPRLTDAGATVWSTTERDLGEVLAWVMDFREGTSDLRGTGESLAARCVRSIP